MRRRDFIKVVAGSAAVWPFEARAQQPDRMRRVGVLMAVAESDADVRKGIAIFQQQLRELGWRDNQNIRIDYRWGMLIPVEFKLSRKSSSSCTRMFWLAIPRPQPRGF
jgi:hypothetical protein